MSKTCKGCSRQSPVCCHVQCDSSWLAKAAGWTVTSSRNWYCLTCSAEYGRMDMDLMTKAKEGLCGTCLEFVGSVVLPVSSSVGASSSTSMPQVGVSAPAFSSSISSVPAKSGVGCQVRLLENMANYPLASAFHLCPLPPGSARLLYTRGYDVFENIWGRPGMLWVLLYRRSLRSKSTV